jgi:hypothetical protein
MPDHRRAQLHRARFRMYYKSLRTRMCILEECVRIVQLEGELQAAKSDMMAPRPLL